jgi:hypothetical protein
MPPHLWHTLLASSFPRGVAGAGAGDRLQECGTRLFVGIPGVPRVGDALTASATCIARLASTEPRLQDDSRRKGNRVSHKLSTGVDPGAVLAHEKTTYLGTARMSQQSVV